MGFRIVRDTGILPRMSRDVARHNRRVREAIRKNIAQIVAREQIITSDSDKVIRVSIPMLKEWQFRTDDRFATQVGLGDGLKKVTCPACRGAGCDHCGDIGKTTEDRSKRVRRWMRAMRDGPDFDPSLKMASSDDDLTMSIGDPRKPRSLRGDRIGKDKKGQGSGSQGGSEPGFDAYETDITIGELEQMVFDELELPNLEDRGFQQITKDSFRFDRIRKVGPMSALDKKRTIKENIVRNARDEGKPYIGNFDREDLRYRTWDVEEEEEAAAVVFAIMDVSGSMDEFKKFIARTFYAWMVKFLETQYDMVDIVFIAHHTEAKEVSEEDFFHKVESGGTYMSSGWKKTLEIMDARYPTPDWNVYVFHFSDGENWSNDNQNLAQSIQDVLDKRANMIGYGEIRAENPIMSRGFGGFSIGGPTAVMTLLGDVFKDENKFVRLKIDDEDDVWPALQTFFSKDPQEQIRRFFSDQGDDQS